MASNIQKKTIQDLEKNGYFVINLTRTNKNGIADLLALKDGEKPLFIECKELKDTLKPLQKYRGLEVQKYGCEWCVVKAV